MAWMLCSGSVLTLSPCVCVHVPLLAVAIPSPARHLAQSLVPTAGCAFEVRLQGFVILTEGWEPLALMGACLKDGMNQLLY